MTWWFFAVVLLSFLRGRALFVSATSPVPYQFLSFNDDALGQTKVPGDIVHVYWQFQGDTGYDSCFLAIRPLANLHDDDAYVVGTHPQCGASSANLQIPEHPFNEAFPYNGSQFIVRMNTPFGTFSDAQPFTIAKTYSEPWSRADSMARGSLIVACIAVVFSVIVAFIPIWFEVGNRKKHEDTSHELLEMRHRLAQRVDIASLIAEIQAYNASVPSGAPMVMPHLNQTQPSTSQPPSQPASKSPAQGTSALPASSTS